MPDATAAPKPYPSPAPHRHSRPAPGFASAETLCQGTDWSWEGHKTLKSAFCLFSYLCRALKSPIPPSLTLCYLHAGVKLAWDPCTGTLWDRGPHPCVGVGAEVCCAELSWGSRVEPLQVSPCRSQGRENSVTGEMRKWSE